MASSKMVITINLQEKVVVNSMLAERSCLNVVRVLTANCKNIWYKSVKNGRIICTTFVGE